MALGDFDLAAEWAGFKTVAFCEQNKFCQKVLAKHWPGVPIFDDIFELSAESLERRGIRPGEIKLISGGFPCQPYSHAGKRLGNEDDRALWPEMLRVIREIKPVYVLGENVPGLISLALDGVLSDLEKEGYETSVYVLPACAVNAPHQRNRVFIVAYSNSQRQPQSQRIEQKERGWVSDSGQTLAYTESRENNGRGRGNLANQASGGEGINTTTDFSRENVADPTSNKLSRNRPAWDRWAEFTDGSRWATQPGVGMLADGISERVARLKALGNAVVPAQAYPLLKAIADFERMADEQRNSFI